MENSCRTESNTAVACNLDTRTPILHPVVIGANQTSIILDCSSSSSDLDSDTESESERTYLNQLAPIDGSNGVVAPNSNISVEDSNNVIFGTAIHYNGPVTIYQSVTSNTQTHNGRIGYHEQQSAEDVQKSYQQETVVTTKLSKGKLLIPGIFKWVLLFCLTCAIIGVITTISVIVSSKVTETSNNYLTALETFSDDAENNNVLANVSFEMHTRNEWLGKPSSNFMKPLNHPTEYVIISHTVGAFCTDFASCSAQLRSIQTYHMHVLKAPDIGYNFLIGGDGDVYVGRGWDNINFYKDKNIGISIIGDYSFRDKMTSKMISTLDKLLELGVQLQKLAVDYKVVCHNQTTVTISPGENVYKEIVKLRHYYPRSVSL